MKNLNINLETLIKSIINPLAIIDVETYEIIIANEAYYNGDYANKKCYQVSHKIDSPCSSENHICPIKKILEIKKDVRVEHIHYDKDGNEKYINIFSYPVFENNRITKIIEYCIDQTELKKTLINLEKQKEQFELCINGSNDGIWDWDIITHKLFLSKRWKEILGYKEDELENIDSTFFDNLYE